MDLLAGLVWLAIQWVLVALVIGVLVWGYQRLFPQGPYIVAQALIVLGVLLALYLLLIWLGGARFPLFPPPR
jgi:hypothetical protein